MTFTHSPVTTVTEIQRQKKRKAAIESLAVVKASLQEQREAWLLFKNSADRLEEILSDMAEDLDKNWHDAEKIRDRIEQNKAVIDEIAPLTEKTQLQALTEAKRSLENIT